jgi:hypothetical protein
MRMHIARAVQVRNKVTTMVVKTLCKKVYASLLQIATPAFASWHHPPSEPASPSGTRKMMQACAPGTSL